MALLKMTSATACVKLGGGCSSPIPGGATGPVRPEAADRIDR